MKGLFPDKEVKNPAAEEPWRKSETDRMLDLYFAGTPPDRIAIELKRDPHAVKVRLSKFIYNDRDFVERYEPRQRISRKGKRLTENENQVIAQHRKRDLPPSWTARLLARSKEDWLGGPGAEVAEAKGRVASIAPMLDLIWAHRYIFFVYKKRVITDEVYDALVAEEVEFGGGKKAFAKLKEHRGWPNHIKSLALYLFDKGKEGK